MCLIFIKIPEKESNIKFVLASNRDEFLERKTENFQFRNEGKVFSGKDVERGGSWMGLAQGRFAAITNLAAKSLDEIPDTFAKSRGSIVTEFLETEDCGGYLTSLSENKEKYDGFNFLASDEQGFKYVTNKSDYIGDLEYLQPGVHGLSNSTLNDCSETWRKVDVGKQMFDTIVSTKGEVEYESKEAIELLNDLLLVMSNKTEFPNKRIQGSKTSIFVQPVTVKDGRQYGTRSQFVCIAYKNGKSMGIERVRKDKSDNWETIDHMVAFE